MVGGRRGPQRPHRLWTLSRDRLCLSSGPGIVGLPFGLLFSTTGGLVLFCVLWGSLAAIGLVRPVGQQAIPADQALWKTLLAGVMVLFIGAGHLAGGTLLLQTLRATIDRARHVVIVRSGWLGLRCQRMLLSEFPAVCVLPSTHFFSNFSNGNPDYDIVITGEHGAQLVVGIVTLSEDLAQQVAGEVRDFIRSTQ